MGNLVGLPTPPIAILGKMSQEDHKMKVNLNYVARPSMKENKKRNGEENKRERKGKKEVERKGKE